MGTVTPINGGDFKPAKISDMPEKERERVLQCPCGCQIWMIYEVGQVQCLACGSLKPTVDIF